MARGGYSSSNYFTTNTGSNAFPISISLWFRTTSVSAIQMPFHWGIGGSGSFANSFGIFIRGDLSGDLIQAFTYDSGAGSFATTSTGYTSGQWHHALAVFAAVNDRRIYIDGGGKGTEGTSRTPAGHNLIILGIDLTGTYPVVGDIAEVSLWGSALTDADAVTLAAGAPALSVSPSTILANRPMPERESGGLRSSLSAIAWTETGACTQIVHPDKVLMPEGIVVPQARNPINPMHYERLMAGAEL